jgi:predicted metal-dependent phosphoesterase TrpH
VPEARLQGKRGHFAIIDGLDNYDLHNHSTASDGLLSPTALIELAARTGADAIALTDHDTTDGVAEAQIAARRLGIGFIPGVEISVSWGDTTLHVVGLMVDPASPSLCAGLEGIRKGRFERAQKIADALAKLGMEGTFEGAYALAENKAMIGRTHFARHLVNTGAVKDLQHAFDKYLAKGKPAYVSHRWASLEDAVRWIRESGGTPVLAHPGRYKLKPMMRDEMLADFKRLGGQAIEVITGSHRPEEYPTWQRLALEHGFLASRGADYHGPGESPAEPGTLPQLHASLTPVWSGWKH